MRAASGPRAADGTMQDYPDERLLELARQGEADAFAELAARAYPALYDFLIRVLLDERLAATAAEGALVAAMRGLATMPRGVSFRAWALGLAHGAAMANTTTPAGGASGAAFSEAGEVRAGRGTRIPAGVAWEAVSWLEPRQYALLDLHFRQGLSQEEVARILRISASSARSLLGRLGGLARDVALASAVVTARRDACAALAAGLLEAGGFSAPGDLTRFVDAHIAGCRACRAYRRSVGDPLAAFASLRPVPPPAGAAEAAVANVVGQWAQPTPVIGVATPPPDRPPPAGGGPEPRRGAVYSLSGLAGLALLVAALFWPPSPLAVTGHDRSAAPAALADESPTATSTRTPLRTPTPAPGGTVSPSATETETSTPTPTASPEPTTAGPVAPGVPSATPSPSQMASPSATASPSPTRTATPSPTPCTPLLSANVPSLTVGVVNNAVHSSSFVIYNLGCGNLPFTPSVMAGEPWLSILPQEPKEITGPSNQYAISVYVDPTKFPGTGEGSFAGTVQIDGGAAGSVSVTVNAIRAGSSPSVSEVTACEAEGVLTYTARVVDDFGVVSVYVEYQADVSGQATMARTAGTSRDGQWRAEFAVPAGFTSARIVAVDGAGQARFQPAPDPVACQA